MANFRCERAFVMLDEPIPGFNHLQAVDAVAFANLLSDELTFWMTEAGETPLVDFLYAPFDRPKWRPASKGMKSAQAAINLYRKWLEAGSNPLGWSSEQMEREVVVLEQVLDVLDRADARDRRFHFAARDLG